MADQRAGGISWTEDTWNAIRGCRRKNKDCINCYAEQLAATRLIDTPKYKGLAMMTKAGPRWTGKVTMDDIDLLLPLRWKRPRLVFVNSMSDFFYEELTDDQIDAMIAVMALAHWHRFQVLTKRPERMLAHFERPGFKEALADQIQAMIDVCTAHGFKGPTGHILDGRPYQWPLPHVWWGASMGHQAAVNEFMPLMQQVRPHASVLWVSAEPLIEEISISPWLSSVDWLVAGGESGKDARPMPGRWPRRLRDQSVQNEVAFHFKQWGQWGRVTHYNIGGWYQSDTGTQHYLEHEQIVHTGEEMLGKIGKKAAGRMLDGRLWDEYPKAP